MPRQRAKDTMYVGGRFAATLIVKFGNLARSNGVSMSEALRRVITQSILSNRIPGIDVLDLEKRENEKWGSATPVYDGGLTQTRKNTTGQVKSEHPGESTEVEI